MADLLIFYQDAALDGGALLLNGVAYASPDSNAIPWEASVGYSDLAATINAAMKDAAVAAAARAGYTVGVLDKKTLMSGAVGL